jgi:hypothetical protein
LARKANNKTSRSKIWQSLWPGHRSSSPGPKTGRHHPGYVGQKSEQRPAHSLPFSGRKKKTQTGGTGQKTNCYIWPQTGRPGICNNLKIKPVKNISQKFFLKKTM